MKDLFEVRFETKMVVASDKLPKGLTEPFAQVLASTVPLLEQMAKEILQGLKKENEK